MPLKVTIDIVDGNETRSSHIQTLYIGRLDSLQSFTQTSNYVVADSMAELNGNDPDAVFFTHKYDDGAEICVQKAIDAREKSDAVWRKDR